MSAEAKTQLKWILILVILCGPVVWLMVTVIAGLSYLFSKK